MADLLLALVSQDATAIVKTPIMTRVLNTFMMFSLMLMHLFQVKKLVIANTEISVMLTQVITLNSLISFSPLVLCDPLRFHSLCARVAFFFYTP